MASRTMTSGQADLFASQYKKNNLLAL